MSLKLVAISIGHPEDITLRALSVLRAAEIIILEERKEGSAFLRQHDIKNKEYYQLNEHTAPDELQKLAELCEQKDVALITDAGTPGFCDPGADLVRLCRQKNIPVESLPGASSLMTLLSLSSQRLDEFYFRGFLPAETEARQKEWTKLQSEKRAFVMLDTPYRLQKTLDDIEKHFPQRQFLLALDLTQPTEQVLEGTIKKIRPQVKAQKAEFLILFYAQTAR